MLLKKLFGNDLVGRSVKYLIKCPYYSDLNSFSSQLTSSLRTKLSLSLGDTVTATSSFHERFLFNNPVLNRDDNLFLRLAPIGGQLVTVS